MSEHDIYSRNVLVAALAGFAIGDLPDHSLPWVAVKLAFAIALTALLLYDLAQHVKRGPRE